MGMCLYVGVADGTERRAYILFEGHIQKCSRSVRIKTFGSFISKYIFNRKHQVDILKSFSIINRQSNSILLKFTEAIVIEHLNLDLCIQKEQ